MRQGAVVVLVGIFHLLVICSIAAPLAVVSPVSESGDRFHLLQSVTVDGGEDGDDESRGVAVADDGSVYVTGYISVAGQGRNIWLAKYSQQLVYQDSVTINGEANGDDEGYTIAFDEDGHLFLVGYMTEVGEGHNIWLGKLDTDLVLIDQITVNGPSDEHDDGYGLLFDSVTGNLFLAGTVRVPGEDANIWLGIYDVDLDPVDSITMNGPADDTGRLYHAGTYTETVGGTNIWLACFNPALDLEAWVTLDGPAGGYDTGIGVAMGIDGDLYVSAIVSDPIEGFNIWIGRYDVSTVFADGFESGDLTAWSSSRP